MKKLLKIAEWIGVGIVLLFMATMAGVVTPFLQLAGL